MNMRKLLAMLTCVLLLTSLLVGCSGDTAAPADAEQAPAGEDAPAEESAEGDVTLTYWTAWSPDSPTETESEKLIEQFQTDTGIGVDYELITYDMMHNKVLVASSAQDTPDIAWAIPEWTAEFYKMGILTDLTSMYDTWEGKSDVNQNAIDACTIDGKILGVPYEMTVRALLVHQSLLDAGGVDIPETWDDMLAIGTSVYDATGFDAFGFTGVDTRAAQEMLVYLKQNGLDVANVQDDGLYRNTWQDSPETLAKATEVFEYYQGMIDNGVAGEGTKTWTWEDADTNFAIAKVGMHVAGNWMVDWESTNPTEMEDVVIAPIPYSDQPATYMEVKPLFIFNGSEHVEEAFQLATFTCSEEYQQKAHADRSPVSSVYMDTKWSKDFQALAEYGFSYPPVTLNGITKAMYDSLGKLFTNGDSPEECAIWLSDSINTALQESGELSQA